MDLFQHLKAYDYGEVHFALDKATGLKAIVAGPSSGPETQVLEGLAEGAEVIVYPGGRVHDGERIRPIKVSP